MIFYLYKILKNNIYFLIKYLTKSTNNELTSGPKYWIRRYKKFGANAVHNTSKSEKKINTTGNTQKNILIKNFKDSINVDKNLKQAILDYGCGTGRYTSILAELIEGNAIGVDVIKEFLLVAKPNQKTKFLLMEPGKIPLSDNSIDFIWICLVLGGIPEGQQVQRTVSELKRVLKPKGQIFLVENTSMFFFNSHWVFRSCSDYGRMFLPMDMKRLDQYFDNGEKISIMLIQ